RRAGRTYPCASSCDGGATRPERARRRENHPDHRTRRSHGPTPRLVEPTTRSHDLFAATTRGVRPPPCLAPPTRRSHHLFATTSRGVRPSPCLIEPSAPGDRWRSPSTRPPPPRRDLRRRRSGRSEPLAHLRRASAPAPAPRP